MKIEEAKTPKFLSRFLRFMKGRQTKSPLLIRSIVNVSVWIFAGFFAVFGKLFSLPLELKIDIATPLVIIAAAMVLTFIFSVIRRKSKLGLDIESCDEFIDFVIDEASVTIMNVGGVSIAICVIAWMEDKRVNTNLMLIAFLCYLTFWVMSKGPTSDGDINRGA